ncbi:MAG: peptidoglycan bridge formation glycyltransferase FemA/FemB family protein [Spirochaetaceae bacterium]|jgi:lipid II:glycine glycyltransferase (peptidoglycan interpeptide bridge formation enzyme)|nr:peptidoglycan bridge formation glycyltransferase FemA/FemB family protein [Spirochaetaceae bacterium]
MLLKQITPCGLDLCDASPNFLQSGFWARFKSAFGWRPYAFLLETDCEPPSPVLVIVRKIAFGACFAYIPWGPACRVLPPPSFLLDAISSIKKFLPKNVVFLRVDLPHAVDENLRESYAKKQFILSKAEVQPSCTVVINLEETLENILKKMKSKWRYNIRLGERKTKVTLALKNEDFNEDGGEKTKKSLEALEIFYALLKETSARDGIAVHNFEYYKTLFKIKNSASKTDCLSLNADVRLYIAYFEEKPVAAVITLFRGEEAVYLYGASSSTGRESMASYALQWRAVTDAKEFGAKRYDFFGIPPSDAPGHPMAGLYRFKTGFGGEIIRRIPSFDRPFKPLMYAAFSCAETFRKNLRDLKKSVLRRL